MRLSRMIVPAVVAAVLAVGPAVAAPAAAAPIPENTLTFAVPAIGGLEAGPASVPSGSFAPVLVTASPGPDGSVTFAVPDPAPYYYQYHYRYLVVDWHNLQTGASGQVNLRHWHTMNKLEDRYAENLPTSATVATGSGPVVATVTVLREQWEAPPTVISVIPGLSAILVP